MIPKNDLNDGLEFDFEVVEEPSYTPRLNQDTYRISGFVDGIESVKQSVYLITNIERYEWLVYTWRYGIELLELYGKEYNFVIAELERTFKEAIMQDVRVEDVKDFTFKANRNDVFMECTVVSIFGEFRYDFEVEEVL